MTLTVGTNREFGELHHSKHTDWAGELLSPYYSMNLGLFITKGT
jgi:hypothetical protein